jgi:hypothetical protein
LWAAETDVDLPPPPPKDVHSVHLQSHHLIAAPFAAKEGSSRNYMSSKIVRKQLLQQQTSAFDLTEKKSESAVKGSKKRKRPLEEPAALVDKKELLRLHVQSMIRVDNAIEARGESGQKSLERLQKERKAHSKLRSKSTADGGVGNSRGSSSQKSRPVHVPTFNKKRYAQEKKEERLRDIAKLLKKAKKKSSH